MERGPESLVSNEVELHCDADDVDLKEALEFDRGRLPMPQQQLAQQRTIERARPYSNV